jgi:hypothetical protein
MLPLPNLEEISDLLLELPSIVQRYESRDPTFSEIVKSWLARAEEVLLRNRLPAVGALASLRASVISAERGAVPAGVTFPAHSSPRKARDAAVADALRRAEEITSDLIRADWGQINEAERLIRQMVTLARYKGYLDMSSEGLAFNEYVHFVWTRFHADADLAQGAVRVTSTVGLPNALALLGRELPKNAP